jgi:hypothetical protein
LAGLINSLSTPSSVDYLREKYGLTVAAIIEKVKAELGGSGMNGPRWKAYPRSQNPAPIARATTRSSLERADHRHREPFGFQELAGPPRRTCAAVTALTRFAISSRECTLP